MADKRMFSKAIIDSDAFLEMPQGSQLLYFHLGMRADDDGFVDNANKILVITGCRKNDIDVLITKRFIIPFENGLIVIRHWRLNNYLRSDRYKGTSYLKEKAVLSIQKNGIYDTGIPVVYQEKNRIEKNSIDKERESDFSLSQQKFKDAFKDKEIDCKVDDKKYNIDLLITKVNESMFLRTQANITLKSCIKLYDKIVADYYKNFTVTKAEPIQKEPGKFYGLGVQL